MKPSIAVCTPDKQIGQLLRLELCEAGYSVRVYTGLPSTITETVCFYDLDAYPDVNLRDNDVGITRKKDVGSPSQKNILTLPFPLGASLDCIQPSVSRAKPLQITEHGASLYGNHIDLTPTECALLRVLVEARGKTVSREDLARCMRGNVGNSAVNVYMHYLRKKLEYNGKRIFLSTRGGGYRVDPQYIE